MTIKIITNAANIPPEELEDWGPVPVPVGEPISQLRGKVLSENEDGSEAGVWECAPGKWVRQVKEAEISTFLSGHCIFHPDNGNPIEINAGDVLFFPEKSEGTWEILETVRKTYLTYTMSK